MIICLDNRRNNPTTMSSIAKLPYLTAKINNIIKEQTEQADIIWSTQDIDYKYKDEWIKNNVKMHSCYYLVIEWFNSDNESSYTYDEHLCEILEACKNEYFGIHGTRNFPLKLYEPKQLLRHYIYKKCEQLELQ